MTYRADGWIDVNQEPPPADEWLLFAHIPTKSYGCQVVGQWGEHGYVTSTDSQFGQTCLMSKERFMFWRRLPDPPAEVQMRGVEIEKLRRDLESSKARVTALQEELSKKSAA